MYIESNGELGFPHHRMGPGGEGGWRHHMQSGGPGAEMQVQPQYADPQANPYVQQLPQANPYLAPAPGMPMHHHRRGRHGMRGADGVEIMGFGADAAPPAGAPPMVVAPPVVMSHVSQHSDTAMMVTAGVLVVGLAYVLYKTVKS